uniref:Uncharacterized protein n=1 Tax=Equus asinus TaxID=9793 RepID=A0A9L0JF92_EQUAS
TAKQSNIRANFENLAKEKEQEDRRKAEAERAQSVAKERQEQEEPRRQLDEQARARKQTPPASPAPQPAQERPPSSPIYEDAASFKAEPSYRGPVSEPEPVYSTEAAYYQDAHSQQGLAYAPEAVYESTEAQGHYPAGASATPSPSVTISGSGFQVPCSWETVVEAHRIAVLRELTERILSHNQYRL